MVVKCLKCGSENVTLTTEIPVSFKFDENGDVKLISNTADSIYWHVEYNKTKAVCKCADCGHRFSYADWQSEIYRRNSSKMDLEKYLDCFANVTFESSMYETPQFKSFCSGLKKVMKQEIRTKYPDLELTSWSKGHFEVSGFITRKSDGAIFYFIIGDVRMGSVAKGQLYRSARHLKDYMGGMNRWTNGGNLLAAIAREPYEFRERVVDNENQVSELR